MLLHVARGHTTLRTAHHKCVHHGTLTSRKGDKGKETQIYFKLFMCMPHIMAWCILCLVPLCAARSHLQDFSLASWAALVQGMLSVLCLGVGRDLGGGSMGVGSREGFL